MTVRALAFGVYFVRGRWLQALAAGYLSMNAVQVFDTSGDTFARRG